MNNVAEYLVETLGPNVKIKEGKKAIAAMERYVSSVSQYLEDITDGNVTTEPKTKVIGLYDLQSANYYSAEVQAAEDLNLRELNFQTMYVPIDPVFWITHNKPSIVEMTMLEIAKAYDEANGKKVIMLTDYCYGDVFKAVNFSEKRKPCKIEGFKNYKGEFTIISENGRESADKDTYYIYVPSKEYRLLTGMTIPSGPYSTRLEGEAWCERPCIAPTMYLWNICDEVGMDRLEFQKAMDLISNSHLYDCGHIREYSILEERLQRLERLIQLEAPNNIILEGYELICRSVEQINSVS